MFPIDPSAIPKLPVRKALVVIDFQSDFLDDQGPLTVVEPAGFVDRTLRLASHFRKSSHVVWACSEFVKSRPVAGESVLTSDEPVLAELSTLQRRSAKIQVDADVDPEAFLTQGGAACVRTPAGSQVPSRITETFGPRDTTFIKSHYSAFKSSQLLHLLRGRLITELYICGSLVNVGVYATAVDAAMYGFTTTIVEDCCGYISSSRQSSALEAMVEATGCDVVQSSSILGDVPSAQPQPQTRAKTATLGRTPDLHEELAALKLTEPGSSNHGPDSSASTAAGPTLEVDPEAQPVSRIKHAAKDAGPSTNIGQSRKTQGTTHTSDEKPLAVPILPLADEKPEIAASKRPDGTKKALPAGPDRDNAPIAGQKDKILSSPAAEDVPQPPLEPATLCEGDTTVILNVLPPSIADSMFDKLRGEVKWQKMSHQGGEVPRLVAVQGSVAADGSMPVYRHPSDEAPPLLPFSPSVVAIKVEAEKHLGHPLNHVLIQFYRDGTDYISEHSDKTLDIVKGSYITNVSLGAERTMVFRTKRTDRDPSTGASSSPPPSEGNKRKIQRARLPHNSLCRVGLKTNMRWLHSIKQDKRMDRDKSDAELAFAGGRISLTFRQIGTFLDSDNALIWGQGATSKTRDEAKPVINGQSDEMVAMLRAFGTENHSSHFDWEEHYGNGFDVLHMSSSPRFFYCSDAITNSRIRLTLAEFNISYAKGSMTTSAADGGDAADHAAAAAATVKFMDNDTAKTKVQGDLAIMLYLDAVYGARASVSSPQPQSARTFTRFQQGLGLLDKWRTADDPNAIKKELLVWEAHAADAPFIAGQDPTLADFAFLPVLHDILQHFGPDLWSEFAALKTYYTEYMKRKGISDILVKSSAIGGESRSDDGKLSPAGSQRKK
ncbi:isochorismatase family protein family [Plectosphaerella plurivora]|uniref:Isochorismatase family protein family n=1 Tax=Plectosphaerella plurivora TaxID=936078 RepID=A0A9P8V2Y7_9PEZI|nr:isochorismatase family protein family [Plectosphaerella plurivora]